MNDVRSTLESPRVEALLARLFAESETSNLKLRQMFGTLTPEERARRMSDPNSDYRQFFSRAKELYMAVSPETARLLYMLARGVGARAIVEFGTSFGISTIHLAAALRDNGGGRLVGSELEPNKTAQARTNLVEAGLDDLVDIREGDALETLSRELPDSIDLVLLDGHKPLYPRILDLVLPRLRRGAYLVADNADASPDYVARVRKAGGGFLSVPFASDVELSLVL
ncbi:MAG TPA: class I SAM-dependent methyltransferase [Polyangiaceae bacterium]|jgi:predicted O-methyltransferase YrrM|nr:class I SAM-dependent methyltransferase [Polyangiaceae bacterium]